MSSNTTDLESTLTIHHDSESAKGHPELAKCNLPIIWEQQKQEKKKYSISSSMITIRPRCILLPSLILFPLLIFIAAGVPFIAHIQLGLSGAHQQKQGQRIQQQLHSNNNQENQSWGYLSSNNGVMKFYPLPERSSKSPFLSWDLSMPSNAQQKTIKLNEMTVSLNGAAKFVPLSGGLQEISNDATTTSQDNNGELSSSTSKSAAWDPEQECIPMADWQTTFHPSCNSIHEMDMPHLLNQEAYSLVSNKGYWRNAWKINMDVAENGLSPVNNIVIKSLKYIHEPNDETFELNRVDGVSMEQLTHSRYITDIYGYCGATSLQEFAGGGLLGDFLRRLKTTKEKLQMAAWVADGLADIHEVGNNDRVSQSMGNEHTGGLNNIITPSIIHNDINLANILVGHRNGAKVPLINDFNIAIFRKKDVSSGEPCRFRGLFVNPQWMAPEQMNNVTQDSDDTLSVGFLNEKIDVYGLGNVLHFVAVGNPPWKFPGRIKAKKISEEYYQQKKLEWDDTVRKVKLLGGKPQIPHEVKNSDDPSIQALLHAMDMCYRSDPDNRASARKVADFLNEKYLEIGLSTAPPFAHF